MKLMLKLIMAINTHCYNVDLRLSVLTRGVNGRQYASSAGPGYDTGILGAFTPRIYTLLFGALTTTCQRLYLGVYSKETKASIATTCLLVNFREAIL